MAMIYFGPIMCVRLMETGNKLDICKRSNSGREDSSVGLTVPYTRFCTLPDNKIPCKTISWTYTDIALPQKKETKTGHIKVT